MRRRFLLLLVLALLLVVPAVPASADPPETFDVPFPILFPDLNVEKSVFINITARDFCDWVADGEEGPPPVIDLVTVRVQETGNGGEVAKVDQDLSIEMWEFDDGVLPDNLVGPCEDIQEQLDDPEAEPWATGTVRYQGNFNGSDGDRSRGVVTETASDTSYRYSNTFHINDRCSFNEAAGVPNCLVDNSKLKEL
jgi:hypothetical protein